MKTKIFSLTIAALLIQPVFAAIKSSEPNACPSVAALANIGVTRADNIQYGWMGWNERNNYGTPEEWTFVMLGLQAEDADDALSKYNAAIPLLSLIEGPKKDDGKDIWACLYADNMENTQVFGIAATPPMFPTSLAHFKK